MCDGSKLRSGHIMELSLFIDTQLSTGDGGLDKLELLLLEKRKIKAN